MDDLCGRRLQQRDRAVAQNPGQSGGGFHGPGRGRLYLSGTTSTLPLRIFNNIQRPVNRPIVNVVAMVVLVASLLPVYMAQRLAGGAEAGVSRRNATAA